MPYHFNVSGKTLIVRYSDPGMQFSYSWTPDKVEIFNTISTNLDVAVYATPCLSSQSTGGNFSVKWQKTAMSTNRWIITFHSSSREGGVGEFELFDVHVDVVIALIRALQTLKESSEEDQQ